MRWEEYKAIQTYRRRTMQTCWHFQWFVKIHIENGLTQSKAAQNRHSTWSEVQIPFSKNFHRNQKAAIPNDADQTECGRRNVCIQWNAVCPDNLNHVRSHNDNRTKFHKNAQTVTQNEWF